MIVANIDPFSINFSPIYFVNNNESKIILASTFNRVSEDIVDACYEKKDYHIVLRGYPDYVKKIAEEIKIYEKKNYNANKIDVEVE